MCGLDELGWDILTLMVSQWPKVTPREKLRSGMRSGEKPHHKSVTSVGSVVRLAAFVNFVIPGDLDSWDHTRAKLFRTWEAMAEKCLLSCLKLSQVYLISKWLCACEKLFTTFITIQSSMFSAHLPSMRGLAVTQLWGSPSTDFANCSRPGCCHVDSVIDGVKWHVCRWWSEPRSMQHCRFTQSRFRFT